MMQTDIKLLDCTLRDGGYVNDWNFGHSVISGTYKRLDSAGVDFIEVGFLDDRRPFDINRTIFPNTESLNKVYEGVDIGHAVPVAMIDYGTCDISNIDDVENSFVKGIRVIFKKERIEEALPFCKKIKEKGYLLSIQAISITAYSDDDMLAYVQQINEIKPFAFSIVDTYGLLDNEKVEHYFHLIDDNLAPEIAMGYHSHNNFQLAFSNTITFLKLYTGKRTLVADATVYGMGKSAGNCATELIAMHMNNQYNKNYDLDLILEIIDTDIMTIFQKQYWGYKYIFYISAMQNCHPNYVQYLLEKKTLSVEAINAILNHIPEEKKLLFDKNYIKNAYINYQKHIIDDTKTYEKLHCLLDKPLLLVGPGNSINENAASIQAFLDEHKPTVISINFLYQELNPEYVFVSNAKRYSRLDDEYGSDCSVKLIATSNIIELDYKIDCYLNYESLIVSDAAANDNALVLLLNALVKLGMKEVYLAGFDGFSKNSMKNYYSAGHNYVLENESDKNAEISAQLKRISDQMKLVFITPTLYDCEGKNE